MAAKSKRVGLFGNFGTGNFGNDGSLESMMLSLRRIAPHDALCCICGNTKAVEAAFGLDTIPINPGAQDAASGSVFALAQKIFNKATLWFHASRHLTKLKAVVVPGTGILDDFRIGPLGWPYDLFCWFLLARLMGVKVVLASIGAGPIHHPLSRWLLKSAARAAHYRSYRDEASKSYMAGIGLDAPADPIFPDLAFSLPTPPNVASGQHPLTIGVGVMTYYGWQKNSADGDLIFDGYIAKLTEYIRWLLAQGHRVRILIGDNSDELAAQAIVRKLGEKDAGCLNDTVAYEPAHTLHEIMQQMAGIDIAVATRFHNVVCALKMGRPTISISYAGKNDVLLAEVGLADFCQHIERLDVEQLKSQTSRLISGRVAYERAIREACARFESGLQEQENLLANLICDHPP
jgi:polysaccharide pyruvyl transferase WcaK-like protein